MVIGADMIEVIGRTCFSKIGWAEWQLGRKGSLVRQFQKKFEVMPKDLSLLTQAMEDTKTAASEDNEAR